MTVTPGTWWREVSPPDRGAVPLGGSSLVAVHAFYDPAMGGIILTGALAGALIAYAVTARRVRATKRARARTVGLVIDADGIRRELADGRSEQVRWADVREVEVICTPVPTADGAAAFAMVTGSGVTGSGEGSGCLVPLGVGWDEQFLAGAARLAGFELRAWSEALSHRPPRRTVVWVRPGQPVAGSGTAEA